MLAHPDLGGDLGIFGPWPRRADKIETSLSPTPRFIAFLPNVFVEEDVHVLEVTHGSEKYQSMIMMMQ